MLLQVDALGQAVGGHQHASAVRSRRGVRHGLPLRRDELPGDRRHCAFLPTACRRCSATYSAVGMNRQNTIGSQPSASSTLTVAISAAQLSVVLHALEFLGPFRERAQASPGALRQVSGSTVRAGDRVPALGGTPRHTPTRGAAEPSTSAVILRAAEKCVDRVRSVAAAAAGDETSDRSSATRTTSGPAAAAWRRRGQQTLPARTPSTSALNSA